MARPSPPQRSTMASHSVDLPDAVQPATPTTIGHGSVRALLAAGAPPSSPEHTDVVAVVVLVVVPAALVTVVVVVLVGI